MWTLMIMNVAEKLHTGFWNQSKKKKKNGNVRASEEEQKVESFMQTHLLKPQMLLKWKIRFSLWQMQLVTHSH